MPEKPKSLLHAVAERFKARGLKVPKEISSALKHYDVAPPAAQQRILNAFAVAVPKAALPQPDWIRQSRYSIEPDILERARGFCPAYPQVAREVQARLVLGHKPEKILPGLTPAEARKALTVGYDNTSTQKTAAAWILRDFNRDRDASVTRITEVANSVTSVPVARWLASVMSDKKRREALLTEHEERGVGGAVIRGRFIDRVDEIRPEDLPNGPKTSVRDAFQSAVARAYATWEKGSETDENRVISPPKWWKPVKYAKLVNTPGKLVREGREMSHCVGGPYYLDSVRRGQSVIVSFNIKGERATAQLSRDGTRILQYRGPHNREPAVILQRALNVLRRKHWRTIGPDTPPAWTR
jgi:hypothetical protein